MEEYVKAVAYYERCHAMSAELGMAHKQTHALGMGVALRLEVRADRQGPAAGALPKPLGRILLLTGRHRRAWMIDKGCEVAKWLL